MTIYPNYKDDLRYSRRCNVTLLPRLSIPRLSIPRSGNSAYGFVGAYEDQAPIPESLRLTMGWQLDLVAPFQEAVEFVDETVIYAGMPYTGFGHFLLDAMARLWYAKDHREIPIVWDAKALPALAAPIFDLVGIRNRHLFLDRPMRFREVIFPFPGVAIGDYFLKGHAEFLGAFKGSGPISGKKLYLSRRNIKSGVVVAEEEIEDLVKSFGFQVYYPEQHTVSEQLEEISTSSIVLGVEGSALHSVVLLKTPIHTRFFALARHRLGGGVFEHIRLQKGIRYTTLNLLQENKPLSATSEVDLDIDLLRRLLLETKGLEEEYPLGNYVTNPEVTQRNYLDAINKFKLNLTATETADYDALRLALKRRDLEVAKRIASKFSRVRC